jgi:ribonuclease-3
MDQLQRLQESLGYSFEDPELLVEALTHSTFANENVGAGVPNERLEFLGDAVVDLIAAHLVFTLSDEPEGELTRRRARVVRQEALADMAEALELGEMLRLGQGQGVASRSMLADAFEAVVGAVFLDGGYPAVERCFSPIVSHAIDLATETVDFKTQVQETCHRLGHPPPRYQVVAIDGPDHARVYTCEILVDGEPLGRGTGSSKKIAEQECARAALARLEKPPRVDPGAENP